MSGFDAASLAELKARGTVTADDVHALLQAYTDGHQLTQETARLLIAINATARELDAGWTSCFVDLIADFLVLQWDPIGYLTAEHADWIIAALSGHNGFQCAAGAKSEMEMLIGLLSLSRWSPQKLAAFALARQMFVSTAPPQIRPVGARDVEMLRRVLYAFGHDDSIAMTRIELEQLFAIDAASPAAETSPEWAVLIQKALMDGALTISGYLSSCREMMLSPDPVRSEDAVQCDWTKSYRKLTAEDAAIARLERQKIEIVTHETVPCIDAAWFVDTCQRPQLAVHVQSVLGRLASSGRDLAPGIHAALAQGQAAA
jgi:hypothetical protein